MLSRSKAKEERTVLQPKGIEEDRIHFVRAIEEYEGPDPLEKWLEYIKWTKDTFSSGGKALSFCHCWKNAQESFTTRSCIGMTSDIYECGSCTLTVSRILQMCFHI